MQTAPGPGGGMDPGAGGLHCQDLSPASAHVVWGLGRFGLFWRMPAVLSGSLSCGAGLGHRSSLLLCLWSWPGI